jgi:hypothetical protein
MLLFLVNCWLGASVTSPTTHRAADALSVHLLPDLGIALPQGPYATVVGLILDQLGALSGKG